MRDSASGGGSDMASRLANTPRSGAPDVQGTGNTSALRFLFALGRVQAKDAAGPGQTSLCGSCSCNNNNIIPMWISHIIWTFWHSYLM